MKTAPTAIAQHPEEARSIVRVRTHGFWWTTGVRLLRHPTGVIGVILVGLVVLGAIFAPLITVAGPLVQAPGQELGAISLHHPFGTDEFGRDILSRVLYGARISVGVGLLAVLTGAAIGVAFGVIAGYIGGPVDTIVTRVLDVLLAFPPILMGIAITAVIGAGAKGVGIAIGVASIPDFARIARASTLTERERDYVAAAKALGAPPGRIMSRHVLPNIVPPLLVQLSVALSFAVLLESGLSFLGIGVQPPNPSWGSMLQIARTYLYQVPSYTITVGLTLAMVLIGFNFIADALRDILDPRLNRELR
ncbi:MAG: ABC transporter permease [Chloroflexota bacterium]|nr:ABC transporter permease [Chloroflexota bacterium]